MKKLLLMILLSVAVLPLFCEETGEKDILAPILLNFIPGFGVGSFIQGDDVGGSILFIGEIVAGGSILTSLTIIVVVAVTVALSGGLVDGHEALPYASFFAWAGLGIYLTSKLFGVIRPIWYGLDADANLKKNELGLQVAPQITPVNHGREMRVGLGINLRVGLE